MNQKRMDYLRTELTGFLSTRKLDGLNAQDFVEAMDLLLKLIESKPTIGDNIWLFTLGAVQHDLRLANTRSNF